MSETVLVFTQRNDVHAERLCSEVERLGAQSFRIDVEDILQLRLTYTSSQFAVSNASKTCAANSIISAYVRRKPGPENFGVAKVGDSVSPVEYVALQKEALFQEFFFALHKTARFYNSFDASIKNMGKLGQENLAREVGLRVPRTYVGGSQSEAEAFVKSIQDSGGIVCTKPLSAKLLMMNGQLHTRYTELLPSDVNLTLEDLESCPVIFQEYIEKSYEIRATVIDDKICSIKIDSQQAPDGTKVDWRKYNYPKTPHYEYVLPECVSNRLFEFHRLSGLRYSAFDLVRTKDGEYVFLETNPTGQWLWLETLTGAQITRRIAEALVRRY